VSSLHPIEGTISGKPYHTPPTGHLHGPREAQHGTIHGPREARHGTLHGSAVPRGILEPGAPESPESAAVAELGGLIASLGSLSSQAQSLPLSPPTLPSLPQGGYQPQSTDYTQFTGDAS